MKLKIQYALAILLVTLCVAFGMTDLANALNCVVTPVAYAFPSQAVGTSSATATVTVNYSSYGTLGSINVVTQGANGTDFQQVTGGSCVPGQSSFNVTTCTVNVSFDPQGVGQRLGAVLLYSSGSSPFLMGTTFLSGTGIGGLLQFSTSQASIGHGLTTPVGVTVDTFGNLYIGDQSQTVLTEVPIGCASANCQISLPTGGNIPEKAAVDGAGNIYVSTYSLSSTIPNTVLEIPAGCTTSTCTFRVGALSNGYSGPGGIAVDGSGNLYVADSGNNLVVEIYAGGFSGTTIAGVGGPPNQGLSSPSDVAVDAAGNVYIADTGNNRILEVPVAGGSPIVYNAGLSNPVGVAVDASGNLYVTDTLGARALEIPAGCTSTTCETVLATGLTNTISATGIAVDGTGNVYLGASTSTGGMVEIPRSVPPSLNFGSVTVGGAPGTQTASFTNIGNASLTLSRAIGSSPSTGQFLESDSCGSLVAINASCTFSVTLKPTSGSASPGTFLAGSLNLTDNAPNSPQSIPLGGFAIQVPSQLAFASAPPPTLEEGQNAGSVSVYLEDQYGNKVSSASGAVTLTVTGPSGYSQTYGPIIPTSGSVTFPLANTVLSVPGAYAYTVTSTGLSPASAPETVISNSAIVPAQAVGTSSLPTTATLAFDTPAVLGSIQVVTQGTTGLDFQQATSNGGSCAVGTLYSPGQSCTVNVIFAPKAVGQRFGAVQLYDKSSTPNLLATVFLSGTGNGGLLNFTTTQTTLGSGFNQPSYMAVDAAGNIFITDAGSNRVLEEPFGGGSPIVLNITGLNSPEGIALDGAGNLYVSDFHNNRVIEVPAGGGPQTSLGVAVSGPEGLSTDSSGNLYIADVGNNRVVEVQSGTLTQSSLGTGLSAPRAVAVDAAGNLFIADSGNNRIVEIAATSKIQTTFSTTAGGIAYTGLQGVNWDGIGNIYVTDFSNHRVVKLPTNGGPSTSIGTGLNGPFSAAVDETGNVYIADNLANQLIKVQQTQVPSSANLGTAFVGGTPGKTSLSFTNIGNTALSLTSVPTPSQYTEADSCGGSVAVNAACTLNLSFAPTTGALAPGLVVPGTLTLTDNTLTTPQIIPLTGTAVLTVLVPTVQPETEVYGGSFIAGVTLTNLTVGTPTGTITFTTGSKTLCTSTGTLGPAATCNASNSGLSVGTYPVTFTYSGDTHYAPATGTSTLTITPAPLSVTVASATRASGAANPAFASNITGLVPPDTVNVTYSTTAVVSSPPGNYPISATVTAGGNTNLSNYTLTNTAGTLTVTVSLINLVLTPTPEVAVIPASPAVGTFSEVLTFPNPGGATPTGTVTFNSGNTILCTTLVNSTSLSGTTTLSITCPNASTAGLTAGTTIPVTYVYSGDSNYATANGTTSLTVSAAPLGVFSGNSVDFATTLAVPQAAVGSNVSFQCLTAYLVVNGVVQPTKIDTATLGITCNTSPSAIPLTSNTPVTIEISTTAVTHASLQRPGTMPLATLALLLPGFGLVGLGAVLRFRRRRGTEWILVLLVGVLSMGLTACGGHFNQPVVSGITTSGAATPAGTYNVIVTPALTSTSGTVVPPSFAQTSLIVPITVASSSH